VCVCVCVCAGTVFMLVTGIINCILQIYVSRAYMSFISAVCFIVGNLEKANRLVKIQMRAQHKQNTSLEATWTTNVVNVITECIQVIKVYCTD